MITTRLIHLVLLSLALMQTSTAQDLPGTLVCYDDLFQPFFMKDGDTIVGINVDLISEAGRRLGIQVQFRQMPFRRLEFELSRGKDSRVSCGFAFSKTALREKNMLFGHIAIQPTDYFLFVRDDSPGIVSVAQLKDKVIGVRSGFRVPDVIADGASNNLWHIDDVDNDEVNFRKLALKRVDAVLTSQDVGNYTLRNLKMTGVRPLSPALMHFDTYMAFPNTAASKPLAEAFDRALADIIADGTFRRIREKYLGTVK